MSPRTLSLIICILLAGRASGQMSITDDLDRTITLDKSPQRIISLAPSITETLFAIGAGELVVGVTDYCNFPPEAKSKRRIGGITSPNKETIVSLNPDLLIMSMEGNLLEDFATLTNLGIPVFVSNPRTLEGIYHATVRLGELTGLREQADQIAADMKLRASMIAHEASKYKRKRVLFIVSLQPLIVVGSGTFISEMLELVGAENVARSSASTYPAFSRESVVTTNPDIIILLSDLVSNPVQLASVYPEWSKLRSIRDGNVFSVNADIVSRPGPRAIDGLYALHRILHPAEQ